MIHFSQTLIAWDTPDFKAVLRRDIEKLSVTELPLQQGLTTGSYALDRDIDKKTAEATIRLLPD